MAGSDFFRIVVTGRQTHGSRPWSGIDPIVAASGIVVAAQTIVSRRLDLTAAPAVVTIGAINGGVRHNIIPGQVEMLGTIRTFSETDRTAVIERLRHDRDLRRNRPWRECNARDDAGAESGPCQRSGLDPQGHRIARARIRRRVPSGPATC